MIRGARRQESIVSSRFTPTVTSCRNRPFNGIHLTVIKHKHQLLHNSSFWARACEEHITYLIGAQCKSTGTDAVTPGDTTQTEGGLAAGTTSRGVYPGEEPEEQPTNPVGWTSAPTRPCVLISSVWTVFELWACNGKQISVYTVCSGPDEHQLAVCNLEDSPEAVVMRRWSTCSVSIIWLQIAF